MAVGEAPHVTICIPVFNGAAFAAKAIRSAIDQAHARLTVLVSDDASADDSLAVCRSFLGDDRVEVHAQPTRLGWIGNCNWLLARAKGDFVCILPHDDWLAPDYVERLLVPLGDPTCAMAFSDIVGIDEIGNTRTIERPSLRGDRAERLKRFLHSHDDGHAFRGLVRRSVVATVGGLRPNRFEGFAADVAWTARIVALGQAVRVAEPLYHKHFSRKTTSGAWGTWRAERIAEAWCLHCCELAEVAIELDLPVEELSELLVPWTERVLGIGNRSSRSMLPGLSIATQKDILKRTVAPLLTDRLVAAGLIKSPAAIGALIDRLAASAPPPSSPATPGRRIPRTPRNLMRFLRGRQL